MPTIVWILRWAVALGALALFAVRERRPAHSRPVEVDRLTFETHRDAGTRATGQGPNGFSQTWRG